MVMNIGRNIIIPEDGFNSNPPSDLGEIFQDEKFKFSQYH